MSRLLLADGTSSLLLADSSSSLILAAAPTGTATATGGATTAGAAVGSDFAVSIGTATGGAVTAGAATTERVVVASGATGGAATAGAATGGYLGQAVGTASTGGTAIGTRVANGTATGGATTGGVVIGTLHDLDVTPYIRTYRLDNRTTSTSRRRMIIYHRGDERPYWQARVIVDGATEDTSSGYTFEVKVAAAHTPDIIALTKTAGIMGATDGVVTVAWGPNDLNLPAGRYRAQLKAIRTVDSHEWTKQDWMHIKERI